MEQRVMRERDVFIEALRREDPALRRRYLDGACGSDAAMRRRVEALLAVHDRAGSFLEDPAVGPGGGWPDAAAASGGPAGPDTVGDPQAQAGAVLGPYKLLQRLGEGGMGAVWMAEQTQPVKRRVAVKLVKAGMDSK